MKSKYCFQLSAMSIQLFLLVSFFYAAPVLAKTKKTSIKKPKVSTHKQVEKYNISQDVIEALKKGDLNRAGVVLRDEPTTAKSLYLLREVTGLVIFESSKHRPTKSEAHRYYQNIGIAYHNLYLFLKVQGYKQDDFLKQSLKYYKKSRRYATPMHKHEVDTAIAALCASSGDLKKAEKIINKVDITSTDYRVQEYLAAYYAARGDTEEALTALRAAHSVQPNIISSWLAVGDDFYRINNDPRFIALLSELKFSQSSKELELSKPSPSPLRLKFAQPEIQFRHPPAPQAQPHYKINKTKKKIVYKRKRR